MKKRITIALSFIIIAFSSVNAQFGSGKLEDINTIEQVPLLIILQSKNEKVIKKLSKNKNGVLDKYYSNIENYNLAVKASMGKSWAFSKDVMFVEYNDLESYNSKTNKGKYAYFTKVIDKGDNGTSLLKNKGLITTYNYAIYLTGKKKPVYSMMYSSDVPNEADFKFIAQQIQNYLKGRQYLKSGKKSKKEMLAELNKKSYKLKDKTLLLDKSDLTSGLIDNIESIYKFPFKLSSKEEIDEAILKNDDKIAYLKIVPIGQLTGSSGAIKTSKLMHIQYIMNATNGEVLAYVAPSSGFGLGGALGTSLRSSKNKMKEKDLLKIIKTIEENGK